MNSDSAEAVRRLAQGAPLDEVLDTSSAEAWMALDIGVRVLGQEDPGLLPSYRAVTGHRLRWDWNAPLPALNRSHTPPEPPRLALALCHPNGRVREAALEPAAGLPALLPLLVVRCADWAGPVRERARALLAEVPAVRLVPLAPLVLRLSRREQGGWARDLLDRALREGPQADIETLLTSEDRQVRRLGHRIAIDRGLLSPVVLARTAARAGDAALRTMCADAAVAGMSEDASDEVLSLLLSSRTPMVRSAGVTALRRAGRHSEAEPFLSDRSGIVRACARYVLRQDGVDPLPLYRSMIADPARWPAAAAGLGECGSRADAATLIPLLAHPLPAVRLHAVTGLRALDATDPGLLRPLLDDRSSAVVRAVTVALLADGASFPVEWLRERTAPDRPRRVRVAAARLLRARLGTAGNR